MQIIEVTELAVRSAVIRLRRTGTPLQFVLYPMIHMAEPAFYAAVTRRLRYGYRPRSADWLTITDL